MRKFNILFLCLAALALHGAKPATVPENLKLAQRHDVWEETGRSKRRTDFAVRFFTSHPKRQTPLAENQLLGFTAGKLRFACDKKSGAPELFTFDNSPNLLANASCEYPLWTLTFTDSEGKKQRLYPQQGKFSGKTLHGNGGLVLTWTLPEAVVTAKILPEKNGKLRFYIDVKNLTGNLRLTEVDYPRLALDLPGNTADHLAVLPWRRGRLWPVQKMVTPSVQEYPGSSARFQMMAFYDGKTLKNGLLLTTPDPRCDEKRYTQVCNPVYDLLMVSVRSYPAGRGVPGNQAPGRFFTELSLFDGDWYDAAQLYRPWWIENFGSCKPLHANKDVPEFLKHAPVFLRFYLRESKNLTPANAQRIGKAWSDFLPGKKIPATLYHYARFDEPKEKLRYPVAMYYGYNAPLYPGLAGVLKNFRDTGIACSVFLQSEIINQELPENRELKPSYHLDSDGNPRLYEGERVRCCRYSDEWLTRFMSMTKYLLDNNFAGIYIDTFGKSKINFECHNSRHGHAAGGGNVDWSGQMKQGRMVKKYVKSRNPEIFIGGEACTESFAQILDYKLNATNAYNGQIPLERALYGDYFLSHGRTISGTKEEEDSRLIALDYLEGIIPGRFFHAPPKTPGAQEFLKRVIGLTEHGFDYLRTGRMLRPLKFSRPEETVKLPEVKTVTKVWQNNVFRSYKDGSVGIAVAMPGRNGEESNSLVITEQVRKEWDLPANAVIERLHPDGRREKLGKLSETDKIPLKLSGAGVEFFIVSAEK